MTTTLQVLADRHKLDDFVGPGEVLDLRFEGGKAGMSLRAARLLLLFVSAAGGDAGKAVQHVMRLSDLNETAHRSKEDLLGAARELMATTVRLEKKNAKGRPMTVIGPLLGHVERDEDDDGELRFELSTVLRDVLVTSNHWAILSRQAVNAFQSRYSLRLYELVSLRVGLQHVHSETFTVDELRRLFGVPAGKLVRWPDLRRFVLDLAIGEVSHLTGLVVSYEVVKRGRAVTGVKLAWSEKDRAERDAAKRELDAPKVGRSARREGTVEKVIDEMAAFPERSIRFTEWETIAKNELPTPTPDIDRVADDFRQWSIGTGKPLRGAQVRSMFAGFCAKQKPAN